MNRVAVACRGLARPPWAKACERFCRKILERLGETDWEVSLLLCDDETIRELNARYRKLDRPTDVLSFPQTEGEGLPAAAGRGLEGRVTAGDVVISLDRLKANSREFGVSEDEELRRLLVHGFLHLAGRDHAGDGAAEPMLAEQEAILEALRAERILGTGAGRGRPVKTAKRVRSRRTANGALAEGGPASGSENNRHKNRARKRRK
jgi:probable rRNA maturation factor